MAGFLWACWDGGGNLAPALGIAVELRSRGHDVVFAGRAEMIERVSAADLAAVELTKATALVGRFVSVGQPALFGYVASPAVGEEILDLAGRLRPDVVVVDSLMSCALMEARRMGAPVAVMMHTFLHRILDRRRASLAAHSNARKDAGFPPLPALDDLIGGLDLIQVNTLAALDGPPRVGWPNIRHGAPVLYGEACPQTDPESWDAADHRPLVLVSLSTYPGTADPSVMQGAVDSLADLPVRVVLTTGGAVPPGRLIPPHNCTIVERADHELLMAAAAVVVSHGGHGTTMRALAHGLPVVCLVHPSATSDQGPMGRAVEEWKVGARLAVESVQDLGSCVAGLLSDPEPRGNAIALSRQLTRCDGAVLAADNLEVLMGLSGRRKRPAHAESAGRR